MGFTAEKITDQIYWVGAIDWTIKDFHGYATHRGTTYNAYLILDEKPTLIDTVKAPFFNEMLERIASILPPEKIEYIISNHAEMDHSGSLPQAIEKIKPTKVFTSVMGEKALKAHLHNAVKDQLTVVKNDTIINIGKLDLGFLETRMLHWPDSMFTIIKELGIVFTNDVFGMHVADSARFAKDYSPELLETEGERYFANILLPYAPLITKLFTQIQEQLPLFHKFLPDHGPIWDTPKDIQFITSLYHKWIAQKPTTKVIVLYDTMWKSTERMATYIVEGLRQAGLSPKLINCRASHRSDLITELLSAGGLIVGSPTLNNQIFPALLDILTYVKGLKPKNKYGATFGSYGWSGEAPLLLKNFLSESGFTILEEPLKLQYVPTDLDDAKYIEFGISFGEKLKKEI